MENSSFQLLYRQLGENQSELEIERNANPEVNCEELAGENLSSDNLLAGEDGLSGERVSGNVEASVGDPSRTERIGNSDDIVESDANSSFEEIPNNFEETNEIPPEMRNRLHTL